MNEDEIVPVERQVKDRCLDVTAPDAKGIKAYWGDGAWSLLKEIKGDGWHRRRVTLLRIADYKLAGLPIYRVYELSDTLNERNHYKWLAKSPAYRAAFDHLMDMSTSQLQYRLEAEERGMIESVEYARVRLGMMAGKAANAVQDALEADTRLVIVNPKTGDILIDETQPDHAVRLRAAAHVHDRNPETAKNRKSEISGSGDDGELIIKINYAND